MAEPALGMAMRGAHTVQTLSPVHPPATRAKINPEDALYQTVLFEPLPDTENFSVSRSITLPGQNKREIAIRRLFEALQERSNCIGGTIVLRECTDAKA